LSSHPKSFRIFPRWSAGKKNIPGRVLLFAAIVAITVVAGSFYTSSTKQRASQATWPTREELFRTIWESRSLLTVYPGAPAELAEAFRSHYESLPRGERMFRQRFLSDREFPSDSLGLMPLSIVGSVQSNRLLKNLLGDLPIKGIAKGFRFNGVDYTDSTDVLALIYPNPRNRRMLLTVLTGNSDVAILHQLKQSNRPYNRLGDYVLFREGRVIAFGFFQDSGPEAWEPRSAEAYDLLREQKSAAHRAHFSFVVHGKTISAAEIDLFAQREEVRLQKLIERLALSPSEKIPQLAIHLWDSLEEKGLFTGETRLAHTNAMRNEVHLAWTDALRGDDFVEEAQWFIAQMAGQTQSPAMREGLAIALSDQWRGVGHLGWAARLVQTGNAPPLAELLDEKIWAAESDLVRQPLLGSLAEFLLERWGAEKFLSVYQSWPTAGFSTKLPNGDTQEKITAEWEKYLRATPAIQLRHERPPKMFVADFHRGFCYAHEGYQIRNGYLGSLSKQSLDKLAELHVNAISVTPFGYLPAPDQPDFLRRSSNARSENDESLVQAKLFAERLGMRVMLKPHLLMRGRDWGWPGMVKMHSSADWKIFFNRYARWMLHYAMLAEIYDFDSLCIGVELVQASHPFETVWREMIARWRGIYSGPMIYAANWGDEFEKLGFWDALDAIGLNCYYPLSEKDSPTDEELYTGATQIAGKIEAVAKKFRKPVLITEIGFTSSARPWLRPHTDNGGGAVDLDAQRRCYEAMFRALWGKPWLAGTYWWKWPTMLSDGGARHDNFTPNGKPAAQVVARWYGRELSFESTTGP
jgi:hypothetical protein